MEQPIQFLCTSSNVSESGFELHSKALKPYVKRLTEIVKSVTYTEQECSIVLPSDTQLLQSVNNAVKRVHSKKLKYIFVIGIGGSSLGTKAIYDALYGSYDSIDTKRFPKILFLETNDPEYFEQLSYFLEHNIKAPEEYIVNVVTKSGCTTETIVNAEYVLSKLISRFGKDAKKRIVITTDDGSPLATAADKEGFLRLSVPKLVGGRYSVFSAVGLFPLALAGVDVEELRKGAEAGRAMSIATNIKENPAVQSAAVLMYHYTQKKSIHDTFLFHPELESVGRWYRQLMGESIGKERDVTGKVVHAGITPGSSIGSTDLHSVGQLYLGGPKDKITTFVRATTNKVGPIVPEKRIFPEVVPQINGKSMKEVMEAIHEGVKIAYTNNKLPFMEVVLSGITPYSLGGFLQFKMIEIMYLGLLMEVNAFDQPNVESYKKETKRILMEE